MKKRKVYEKPPMQVFELKKQQQLLVGSANAAPTGASIDDYEDGTFSW